MEDNNSTELTRALQDIAQCLQDVTEQHQKDVDLWWNELSDEQQQKAFCAVIQRIHQGDLKEERSYRGVLYNTFGFGPDMYGLAQDCGYLAIHNAIADGNDLMAMTGAKTVEVTREDAVTRWKNIDTVSLQINNGVLSIKIDQGNDYV